MSRSDSEKDSFGKGYSDYNKSGGVANPNPLTEFFHPTYSPPSEREDSYGQGWDQAKHDSAKKK